MMDVFMNALLLMVLLQIQGADVGSNPNLDLTVQLQI